MVSASDNQQSWSPKTGVMVLVAFAVSICLANINKFIYEKFVFRYALFITAMHMVFSWAACSLFLTYQESQGNTMVKLNRVRQITLIGPLAVFSTLSIACGNLALVYIYPSLHEMLQSCTPLFTVISSVVILGARYNNATWLCMIPVSGGCLLCAKGEVSFSVIGISLSLMAVLFRGVKNVLQGYMLQDQKLDAVTLLYYMAPMNLVIFLIWSVCSEGLAPIRHITQHEDPALLVWLLMSSMLACSYNIFQFVLIFYVGSVGFTVINNIRTPIIIVASVLLFRNSITFSQVMGFAITLMGVYCYNRFSVQLRSANTARDLEMEPALGGEQDDENDSDL